MAGPTQPGNVKENGSAQCGGRGELLGIYRKAYAARLGFLAPAGTMNLTEHANVCGRGSGAALTYKFLASIMII
jgi:hypothetical protein